MIVTIVIIEGNKNKVAMILSLLSMCNIVYPQKECFTPDSKLAPDSLSNLIVSSQIKFRDSKRNDEDDDHVLCLF